jgi:hypothetical protein
MTYVGMDDVKNCLFEIEHGREFSFSLYGDALIPLEGEETGEDVVLTVTPNWYVSVYCANDWVEESLKGELENIIDSLNILDSSTISTKFTVMMR